MLSPNTLLNKARYRIDRLRLGGPEWQLYEAEDLTSNTRVLVAEYAEGETRVLPHHEGFVRFADSFTLNRLHYYVTEPVDHSAAPVDAARAWESFSVALMALNHAFLGSNARCEIDPKLVVRTVGGNHKVLQLPRLSGRVDIESWYVPLERIWNDLDHITQKAVYGAWNEASIADLERPTDERSDLYSLAAVFFSVLTGRPPEGAFERMVVALDGKDPLTGPLTLVPSLGPEPATYLLKCLELRRKDRFASFESAILELPTVASTKAPPPVQVEEPDEILDLGASSARKPTVAVSIAEPPAAAPEVVSPVLMQGAVIPAGPQPEPANDLPVVPSVKPDAEAVHEEEVFSFEEPRRSGMLKFVVAAVVLVSIVGGSWAALRSGMFASAQASPTASLAAAPAPQPSAIATPIPQSGAVEVTAEQTEMPTIQASAAAVPKSEVPRGKPQAAEKITAKPTPAQEAKTKKKVTVDDLINDN